ncbi:hypothetical protein B0I35DRAFT_467806 [Stachybotrys elegans]|uniref:Heterokaryon incompatibility domain-containing protein n=1 Tax=Stachybotrys elegans TaxID=80388 RepID=A0A8K0SZR0_9HYPO|nr:hypothetical protein B0I35DRAFT_467806 [Stachybotrys elegans]
MATISESISSRANALAKMTGNDFDVPMEMIQKHFKDIGDSPEKLRAALNLLFVPQFKPTFAAKPASGLARLEDIDFLGTRNPEQGQQPFRMFDIETGNLVSYPAIGERGQYCMLSHRWKGEELTLSYIKYAQREDFERSKDPNYKEKSGTRASNDMSLVLDQCLIDIANQMVVIKTLYDDKAVVTKGEFNVEKLLIQRLKSKALGESLGWAKKEKDRANSGLKFADMDSKIISNLINKARDGVDEKMKGLQSTGDSSSEATKTSTAHNQRIDEMVSDAKEKAEDATDKLGEFEKRYSKVQDDVEFFMQHNRLRDALDELVRRLQRWKSAIKVHNAIEEAKKIFKTRPFQNRERRYLWTDTCCIDKANFGELSESLSLMGDWYADADFCLVHLDTNFNESDAAKDWRLFLGRLPDLRKFPDMAEHVELLPEPLSEEEVKRLENVDELQDEEKSERMKAREEKGKALAAWKAEHLNDTKIISGIDEIELHEPEWSTRAWTLQELVMSKTTYYVNSEWTPLSRPAESLGFLYYLIPFIALYTEGAKSDGDRPTSSLSDALPLATILDEDTPHTMGGTLKGLVDGIQDTYTSLPWPPEVWARRKEIASKKAKQNERGLEETKRGEVGLGRAKRSEMVAMKAKQEASQIKKALQIATILDVLGFRFPADMNTETAVSEMARSVYLAAADLKNGESSLSEDGKKRFELLQRVMRHVPDTLAGPGDGQRGEEEERWEKKTQDEKNEEAAQDAINFLLRCLVEETKTLVMDDRKCLARFGKIDPLTSWQKGTRRNAFSAQSVMLISGDRTATKATDHAYGLIGVLGVQFPPFHAEGYAAALARLLDQVVIAHNDVSVFNWTGLDMGSPVRGRSLYPASHAAYSKGEDKGRSYNILLSTEIQGKMQDVMATYDNVINVLEKAIDFIKEKKRKNLPFDWIKKIIEVIKDSSFEIIQGELNSVRKIVGYILLNCDDLLRQPPPEDASAKDTKPSSEKGLAFSGLIKRPTLPSPTISLPSPTLSLPSFKVPGIAKKDEEPEKPSTSSKKGSRFGGFGKGIKTPSFGTSKQEPEPSAEVSPPPQSLPVETLSRTSTLVPERESDILSSDNPPDPTAQPWEHLNQDVKQYLDDFPTANKENKKRTQLSLPEDIEKIEHDFSKRPEADGNKSSEKVASEIRPGPDVDEGTISPNPIIVNNSGIESLFDVQRVIVTMLDPEKLRRQVARAAGPRDKISGWCSISTGFARVVVGFSCQRRILEQELDVIQAVDTKVLKGEGLKRSRGLIGGLHLLKAGAPRTAVTEEDQGGDTKEHQGTDDKEAETVNEDKNNTKEELLVSRMIDFIQEPALELVAGEWVLARFSNVPGANWFLCHLELGAGPGQYYGHRIASSEIDFSNASPEDGLVNAWQTYMDRKKRKLCKILGEYLRSRESAKQGDERLKEGMSFTMQGVAGLKARAGYGEGSPVPDTPATEAEKDLKGEDGVESGNDSDGDDDFWDDMIDKGKAAAMAFGDYTYNAAVEKFFEMHAHHLEKTLAASVLKRTPKKLRTAVENINDNKSFLPTMFKSHTRVHMF